MKKLFKNFYFSKFNTSDLSNQNIELIRTHYYFKQIFSVFAGLYIGFQISDYLFYNEKQYLIIREQTEKEYWDTHGYPTYLQPDYVQCIDPKKEGQLCKTWIKIKLKKDQYITKVDPSELQSLK